MQVDQRVSRRVRRGIAGDVKRDTDHGRPGVVNPHATLQ
jgi:hypothetical protein